MCKINLFPTKHKNIATKINGMIYEDLIDKQVWARLEDPPHHDEWELCKVMSIVHAGMKVQSKKKKEFFLIPNNAVTRDVRLLSAFLPYESEHHAYDGTHDMYVCMYVCMYNTFINT